MKGNGLRTVPSVVNFEIPLKEKKIDLGNQPLGEQLSSCQH